jgi:ribosome-associated heat shock protein Hsp15
MGDQIRVDKWLWAVRIFKTRSLASEACKKGYVTIKGASIKPSRFVKEGEAISVKKSPVTYSYLVKGLISKRVGAKFVPDYMEDVTPAAELEILEMQRNMSKLERDRGTGRPTKRERRDIDKLKGW